MCGQVAGEMLNFKSQADLGEFQLWGQHLNCMVLHKLFNLCLPQFPHLPYGDARMITLLLWRIHEAVPCSMGQNLPALATLKLESYTRFTQVGAASGSYLNGAYNLHF